VAYEQLSNYNRHCGPRWKSYPKNKLNKMEISTNTKRFQRDLRAIKCYHKHFILFFLVLERRERRNVRKKASRAGERPQSEESKKGNTFLDFFLFS